MLVLNEDARNILNALNEGITIIDTEGRLVFGNRAYCDFLNNEAGKDIGPVEGYLLRDLRPNARLPDVVKTGKPMCHVTRQEIADFYFTNMYPVYRGQELVGGISVVTFKEDAYLFRDELEATEARSRQVLRSINKANGARYRFEDIAAVSDNSLAVKALAQKAALTDAPILLTAESGAGKELYAQAIHNASPRHHEVFVAINCANFNATTLETELFGYVDGAFPGAKAGGKMGLLEAAAGGTLFLDEVSEMPTELQSKLLRALQERVIRPIGGLKEVPVDVRIIAASNADLKEYMAQGRFRSDLFYRLSTFLLHLPPLRERIEDLPLLVKQMAEDISAMLKRKITVTDDAIHRLMRHQWPGNTRELRNVLEFSAYLSTDGIISADLLPKTFAGESSHDTTPLYQRVRRFEQSEIKRALAKHGSDLKGKTAAAAELGISLASLYNKLNHGDF